MCHSTALYWLYDIAWYYHDDLFSISTCTCHPNEFIPFPLFVHYPFGKKKNGKSKRKAVSHLQPFNNNRFLFVSYTFLSGNCSPSLSFYRSHNILIISRDDGCLLTIWHFIRLYLKLKWILYLAECVNQIYIYNIYSV